MKTYVKITLFCVLILRGYDALGQNTITVSNESELNTPFHEYCPTAFANSVVFITNNPAFTTQSDKDDFDSYKFTTTLLSRKDTANLLLKPIAFVADASTRFSYGPLCFDKEVKRVFFTRSHVKGAKTLYFVELTKQGWSHAIKLPFNNAEFDCAHPSISPDGKKLYFASNDPNGYGGWDLYVSTFINNAWSQAVNLGPTVNTAADEFFPYIHADGTLYFSSDRKKGMGGLDIYKTQKNDNQWVKPYHLPKPINSSADDFGILINEDKKTGYFSSNRAQGKGEDDIFSFTCSMTIDDPVVEESEMIVASALENTEGGAVAMEEVPRLSQILPKYLEYKFAIDTLNMRLYRWKQIPTLEGKSLSPIVSSENTTPKIKHLPLSETPVLAVKSIASSKTGNYLVVVGTYSQKENALDQKKKIEAKGFDAIEIVQYADTRLYGVSVLRTNNETEAAQYAQMVISSKKVDAFVKKLK